MEARIAKLESDVDYIKRDIGELKIDVKETRKEIHSAKIWALLLYVALAAALLGVLGRGFKWI